MTSQPTSPVLEATGRLRILVVGASGYVGGRLVPLLASHGHDLAMMSRDKALLLTRMLSGRVRAE